MLHTEEHVVQGVRCAVHQAGDRSCSEAVVFVHGNPGPLDDWEELAPQVAAFSRVVAMDLPGYGRAERARRFSYTIEGYAGFLGALLEQLDVRRVHLVAHDFGGAWGVRWALDHPHALASLTLIATPVCADFQWHAWAKVWQTPGAGELIQSLSWSGLIEAVMTRDNPRPFPATFLRRVTDFADVRQKLNLLKLYRACRDPQRSFGPLAQGLAQLDPPACIIWGDSDRYAKPKYAHSQARLFSRPELHVIERAGHWPFVDEPARVRDLVCAFLRRQVTPVGLADAGLR